MSTATVQDARVFTEAVRSTRVDVLLALFAGALASIAVDAYGKSVAGDDTFIYMRYVENALHGRGFVYNPGESSYGVTSFLWMVVMTPLARVFGNTVETWKAVTVALTGARAALLWLLFYRTGGSRPTAAALTAVACLEPHSFRWASSGMENALAVLALTAVAWLYRASGQDRRATIGLGALLGALPFIRPELALLGFALLALHLRAKPQARAALIGPAAVTAALCLGLSLAWMGSPIPQTAAAKALFERQKSPLYAATMSAAILVSGASFAGLLLLVRRGERSRSGSFRIATIAAVGASVVYLAYQNQLVSTRYASYLSAPVVLAATLLIADEQRRGALSWFSWAALGLQLAASAAVLAYVFPVTRVSEITDIRDFSEELDHGLLPSDARVALSEIGIFGFYSRRYIIDIVALTDRATLRWGEEHGRPRCLADIEALLLARGATYYIDAFGEDKPLIGERINFTPLAEHRVLRNNFSLGKVAPSEWRLYRLDPVGNVAERGSAARYHPPSPTAPATDASSAPCLSVTGASPGIDAWTSALGRAGAPASDPRR